ncbi:MAG TPA: hypothetical protein VMB21_22195 [Candidatus Limnocylindria bacterium]|jgi:hypothetical protein|nr:hypothetical protein [Candidatus Limnocylindria bacterium]
MNTPDPNADWLDAVEGRRLTPAEAETLRQALVNRPRERARLAEELALNAALEALPPVPASSNFAARVWADIDRDERAARRRPSGWRTWLRFFRPVRLAGLATVMLAVLGVRWQVQTHDHERAVLAANVAELSQTVPDVELLRNYEAIRALHATPKPGDVDLMGALAQQ